MGREEYLLDTNAAIGYIGETLPEKALTFIDAIIDGRFYISVINKIELLGFSSITEEEALKFGELIKAAEIIGLEDEIADATIAMRKQYKVKLPDAIIAASALINGLTIITRNTKDFIKIDGLKVINPFEF